MKMLFSSPDIAEVAAVKSLLLNCGIGCQILNDAMSPAMLNMARYPELWIEADEDFSLASALFDSRPRELLQPVSSQSED